MRDPLLLRALRTPIEPHRPVDQVGGGVVADAVRTVLEGRHVGRDESRGARRRDRVDVEDVGVVLEPLHHAQVRELELEPAAEGVEAPAARTRDDERPLVEESLVGLVVRLRHPLGPASVALRRQELHRLRIREPGPLEDEVARRERVVVERPDAVLLQPVRDALVERVEVAECARLARGPHAAEAEEDLVRGVVAAVELDGAGPSEGVLDALEVDARAVRVEVVVCGQARGEGRVHDVAVDLPVALAERLVEPAVEPALLDVRDIRLLADLHLDVGQLGGERLAGLEPGEEVRPVGRADDRRAGLEHRVHRQLDGSRGVLGERHREDTALGAHGRDALPVTQLGHAVLLVHHRSQRVRADVRGRHGLAHRSVDPADVPDDAVVTDLERRRSGVAVDHRVGDLEAEIGVPREEQRDARARGPLEPLRELRGLDGGLRGAGAAGVRLGVALLGRDAAAGLGARLVPAGGGELRRTEVTLGAHRRGVVARAGLTRRATLTILARRGRLAAAGLLRRDPDVVVVEPVQVDPVTEVSGDLVLQRSDEAVDRDTGHDDVVLAIADLDADASAAVRLAVDAQVPLAGPQVAERRRALEQRDEGLDPHREDDDERGALRTRTAVVRAAALAALVAARPAVGLGRTLVRGGVLGVHLAVAGVGGHVGVLVVGVLVALGRHGLGLLVLAGDLLADHVTRHLLSHVLGLLVRGLLLVVLGGQAVQLGDEEGDVLVERGERAQLVEPLALLVAVEVLDLVVQRQRLVLLGLEFDSQGRHAGVAGLALAGRSHGSSLMPNWALPDSVR